MVEKLRNLPNYAAYSTAFDSILDTTDRDFCMLKPRELNITDPFMRQNYGAATVDRNLTGRLGIIVAGLFYGGLHMIAWGSTAFTSQLEDIAWKISCFVVAFCGPFFAVAGVSRLDMEIGEEQDVPGLHMLLGVSCVLGPTIPLFYLFCRVYLVFEVFWKLAYLDPEVYRTPNVSACSLIELRGQSMRGMIANRITVGCLFPSYFLILVMATPWIYIAVILKRLMGVVGMTRKATINRCPYVNDVLLHHDETPICA